ncbi:MAG: hypothetical protein Q9162_007688 [Coniocarpon cinnabarinum]
MQLFSVLCFIVSYLNILTAARVTNMPQDPFTVHNASIDGVNLFWREAGEPANPTILLLHGYPSSSHQYRDLIPLLSPKYHVLAPDYPGFGFTDVPASRNYSYTFDNIAGTISQWLNHLNVKKMSIYVFDYGAPVGFRLALKNPDSITAIISQNGNAYDEGIGPGFAPLSNYFNNASDALAEFTARGLNTAAGVRFQYVTGAQDPSAIDPVSYTLDTTLLQREGNEDIQLALFRDYKTNFGMYAQWQAYLKERQPPLLAIWGRNDLIFIPPGAEAFKRDVPNAQVQLIDAGHFALETNLVQIAEAILGFLQRKGV